MLIYLESSLHHWRSFSVLFKGCLNMKNNIISRDACAIFTWWASARTRLEWIRTWCLHLICHLHALASGIVDATLSIAIVPLEKKRETEAKHSREASKARQRGGCAEEKTSLEGGQRNTARTWYFSASNVCDVVSCCWIISIFCSRVSRSFALHATECRNLSSSDHLRWGREHIIICDIEANICPRTQTQETNESVAYRFVDIQTSSWREKLLYPFPPQRTARELNRTKNKSRET